MFLSSSDKALQALLFMSAAFSSQANKKLSSKTKTVFSNLRC